MPPLSFSFSLSLLLLLLLAGVEAEEDELDRVGVAGTGAVAPDDVPEDAGTVVGAPTADLLARAAASAWNAAAAAARGLSSALPVSDDELFVELMLS